MAPTLRQRDALPPLTHAHQEALRISMSQLRDQGQDVSILEQLIETFPRLRTGLNGPDRQRIDELDANEAAIQSALHAADEALESYDSLTTQEGAGVTLIDPSGLRRLAEAARQVAEAASEVALRTSARAGLLE